MNKMLVAVFKDEQAADAGLQALRRLHDAGDITLYAATVVARPADGPVHVRQVLDTGPTGAGLGLAVGGLVGLLGGPAGVVAGALTGTLVGAVRDFWETGVGLDFVEDAERALQPGTVALVAELEEEWIAPVDGALEASGATVMRRTRNEVVDGQFDHDVAAFKSELQDLEAELAQAGSAARGRLQAAATATQRRLDAALLRARQRMASTKQEADAKAAALSWQVEQAKGEARSRLEARVKRVTNAYHARGAKLAQAWGLTKQALAL